MQIRAEKFFEKSYKKELTNVSYLCIIINVAETQRSLVGV